MRFVWILIFCFTGLSCSSGGDGLIETGDDMMEAPETPEMPETPEPPAPPPPPPPPPAPVEARFRITFTGSWTAARHPTEFPSGAHFSAPVGAVHGTADIVWAGTGSIASAGIESMAETGGTGTVRGEIEDAVTNGDALAEFAAGGIGAEGSTSVEVTATEAHHLLSLVSMIAPSPDWFVGVRNLDLRPAGTWLDDETIELTTVYDSGTDDGPDFTSSNDDVTPHDPIHRVGDDGAHFTTTPQALATIRIERIG